MIPETKKIEDFLIKIIGFEEFVHVNTQLKSLIYVRECVRKKKKIEFVLVDKLSFDGIFNPSKVSR